MVRVKKNNNNNKAAEAAEKAADKAEKANDKVDLEEAEIDDDEPQETPEENANNPANKDLQTMSAVDLDPALLAGLTLGNDSVSKVKELVISKSAAEKLLREKNGNLDAVLRAYIEIA
ncbi:hypothetical protein HK100_004095 [Physocladia obscura]|uniref:Nascent polypeptide-associated complex subunit alpha-like UBA domain-containing protein n=1 Tax=Physocladia obscura TaxID=109957 RepID=A0AAD5T7C9_9FUNG|nr:hypothetical protein HK100_004095 [Physocladia obscura]